MEGEENEGIFYDKVDPKNSDKSQNSSSLGIKKDNLGKRKTNMCIKTRKALNMKVEE